MCEKCAVAVQAAIDNGISERDAVNWLWANTPFPFAEPTAEQLQRLAALQALPATPASEPATPASEPATPASEPRPT